MKQFFSRLKNKVMGSNDHDEDDMIELDEEYVELGSHTGGEKDSKVVVRPFVIEDFADIKDILGALRDGYTIALINIKPLKEKDIIELKRAISKLKKTVEATKGDIAGVGDDYIVVVPSFATIYRAKSLPKNDDDFD